MLDVVQINDSDLSEARIYRIFCTPFLFYDLLYADREKIGNKFRLTKLKIYTIFAARFRKAVSNGNLKPCTANERIQKIQCCHSADAVQLLLFRYQPFLSYAYRAWVFRCPLSSWRRNGTWPQRFAVCSNRHTFQLPVGMCDKFSLHRNTIHPVIWISHRIWGSSLQRWRASCIFSTWPSTGIISPTIIFP